MSRSDSTTKIDDKSQLPSMQQPTVSSISCQSIQSKQNSTTMRMSPPATLRNWKFHKPLLAVGDANGYIQVFNLATGKLHRELCVHSYAVTGIEWIGLNAFISYAESRSFNGNEVNWELKVTELGTGRSVALKSGKSKAGTHLKETSVIQSVKVSHLRQYFIVIYRGSPFEIWDLESLSLLRRVPKKFSGIVAAEWNPLYSKKVETSSQESAISTAPSVIDSNPQQAGNTAAPPQDTNSESGVQKSQNTANRNAPSAPLRENFVVTNKLGELFHFSIAGNVVKEISKIPPENTNSKAVTAIAWKSDHVVLGRDDGNISVWDLGLKESRTVSSGRGPIRKIRFAPGRGNMKILILFDDGADIWDIRRLRLLGTVLGTYGSQLFKIEDTDWAASDRPVILTSNGTVVVTDLDFRNFKELKNPYSD